MHASIMGEWPAIRWGVHEWASGRQDRTHFASRGSSGVGLFNKRFAVSRRSIEIKHLGQMCCVSVAGSPLTSIGQRSP